MAPAELGEQPEPSTQPPERYPGGADSVADEEKYGNHAEEPTVPDLAPALSNASGDVPPEVTAPDDKQQEPDRAEPEEAPPEPPA